MAGKAGYGKGRRQNREAVYLNESVAEHLRRFIRERPLLTSKSRIIETALDAYMHLVEQYGFDQRGWPNVQARDGPAKPKRAAG